MRRVLKACKQVEVPVRNTRGLNLLPGGKQRTEKINALFYIVLPRVLCPPHSPPPPPTPASKFLVDVGKGGVKKRALQAWDTKFILPPAPLFSQQLDTPPPPPPPAISLLTDKCLSPGDCPPADFLSTGIADLASSPPPAPPAVHTASCLGPLSTGRGNEPNPSRFSRIACL